ncbi:MAG TPA: hypothetical protein PLQ88_04640 [Blastocatellia bacterium]|nr:hypothetical protein [Blastocatellia bacterium]
MRPESKTEKKSLAGIAKARQIANLNLSYTADKTFHAGFIGFFARLHLIGLANHTDGVFNQALSGLGGAVFELP